MEFEEALDTLLQKYSAVPDSEREAKIQKVLLQSPLSRYPPLLSLRFSPLSHPPTPSWTTLLFSSWSCSRLACACACVCDRENLVELYDLFVSEGLQPPPGADMEGL
jgi:hypothetical protein